MTTGQTTPSSEAVIRPLTVDDAEPFWTLRLRALRDHPEAFARSYDEDAATPLADVRARIPSPPDGVILGAWRGAALVGTVGLRRLDSAKQRHKAILWGVYVAPEARALGLARRLLTTVVAHARDLPGLEQIHLSVGSRSPAARHLYASLGFVPYGLERHASKLGPDDYVDEEHLVLVLDRPSLG